MVDTVRLDELFEVKRGRSLNLEGLKSGDVSYVSSGSINNGVIGQVNLPVGFNSISPGIITVARSGSVGFAAYHDVPVFVNENAFYLTPKKEYEPEDLLYYVMVLRNNSKRFGYGRPITAPKLSALQLPATTPDWVNDYSVDTILGDFDKAMVERESDAGTTDQSVDTSDWIEFRIGDLFDIKRGNVKGTKGLVSGDVPVVSAREADNGVAERADVVPQFEGNTLSVAMTGSVGYFAVQSEPWSGTGNTAGLKLKEHYGGSATVLCLLAIATLARQEGVRFNYGRIFSMGRLEGVTIRLPAVLNENDDTVPDWDRLDKKMQELAFSRYVATDSP